MSLTKPFLYSISLHLCLIIAAFHFGTHTAHSVAPSLHLVDVWIPQDEVGTVSKAIKTRLAKKNRENLLETEEIVASQEEEESPSTVSKLNGGQPFSESEVDTAAVLVTRPKLYYPKAAIRDGIEGDVVLFLVLNSQGAVESVELRQRAGYGFDEAAMTAAKSLRFSPAKKNGQSVAVRFLWTCRFRIDA